MAEREEKRKEIIALKKLRRVEVGDKLSFMFENRETVKYQIHRLLRAQVLICDLHEFGETEVQDLCLAARCY